MNKKLVALVVSNLLSGCASETFNPCLDAIQTPQQSEDVSPDMPDPLQPMNKAFFDLNLGLDECLLEPLTLGYEAITPPIVQQGVHNFLMNLSSPRIFLSCVLQGRGEDAATALGRLLLNSTFGFLGLIDVASEVGLKPVEGDFGRTLQAWGMESGPYLVLPAIGPTTFRDGFGLLIDTLIDPFNLVMLHNKKPELMYARWGADLIDFRLQHGKTYEKLKETSLDLYSTIQSIYAQKRGIGVESATDQTQEPNEPSYDGDLEKSVSQPHKPQLDEPMYDEELDA